MATARRTDRFSTVLTAIEVSTIVAGLIAATAILVKGHARQVHDDASAVVEATSACTGDPSTLGTLRAWLDGAELPADPSGPEPAIDDAMRTRGAELFAEHCATCHGSLGDGTGPTAAQLMHPPANFTTGTYEQRTTEHEALPADIDLFRTITRGVHGTAMPPWFALPERDRWALAAHLKTLSKQFAEDEAPAPIDVPSPPTVTPARIARGEQIYNTGGCASCHGPSGRGNGPAATALVYKATGGPAMPRDLRMGRFHRSTRLDDIYLTIVTGFDGTPMASFAKVLPPDDLWDVAIYVHSLAPPFAERADGLRCPQLPDDLRCYQLADKLACPEPYVVPDELVGVRTLMHSLHPST